MKTYKEMTASLLKRREEYEMKRRRGDRIRMTVAGALAALMIINVMIFAPVIARKSKGPDAAPIAEQTTVAPDNGTSDAITDGTTEENGETTQTEITDVTTDPENAQSVYVREFELVEDERLEKFEVVYGNENKDARHVRAWFYVSETEKVKTYRIRYNNLAYHNWEFYDYDKRPDCPDHVKILIRNETDAKIISPEIMTLDLVDGSAEFELTFEYTDITNATFSIYVDLPFDDVSELSDFDPVHDRQSIGFSVATVKGKDFFTWSRYSFDSVYPFAANYFGDVDENGKPLYKNDPYMPEYYDNPWCESLRKVYEGRNSEPERIEENQLRTDEITVCGYINWTDKNNSLHPARNMTVYLIDDMDPENRLSTITDDTGYYVIRYPVSSFYGHTVGAYAELS